MKLPRCILITLAVVLGVALMPVQATPLVPQTPSFPPIPSAQSLVAAEAHSQQSSIAQKLPRLKAVLLVGPIDGDNGSWTIREKLNMDLAAAELESNGVQVYKFYTPNNDWEQIKAVAEGAHFLFYRGHGVYWSPMPTPRVGGFALKRKFVSADDIRHDLHLAPNAIVMLYGCFTAGSSGNDGGSIASLEAQRRVAEYSDPFLEVGAAGYYADWYGDAFQMFVRYLYRGMTLGQAYEAFYDFGGTTVERYSHPEHESTALWLDKDHWGYLKYNNAFVGVPDKTLIDLFGAKVMTLTPNMIVHLAEPSSTARTFAFQVDGTGSDAFNWTANISATDPSWLTVRPLDGSSGQPATVVITPTGKAPGSYEAHIRIVANAAALAGQEQDVFVRLFVAERAYAAYLPILTAEGR